MSTQMLVLVLGVAALILGVLYLFPKRTAVSIRYSPPGLGLLALSGENTLIVGAIIDVALGLIMVSLLDTYAFHWHLSAVMKIAAAVPLIALKYAWSTNLGRNKVPLFQRGVLTRLGRLVDSGPDGNGLMPGYYWFFLGWPFYSFAPNLVTTSAKEFTIKFAQMKVWAVNVPPAGRGAVEGMIDGIANFKMLNLAEFNAAEEALLTLESYVKESARDKVEHLTMEEFIARKNEKLAMNILNSINQKLLKSNGGKPRRFGVELASVNVTQTDNRSKVLEDSWAEVPAQVALAASRATDAAGRVRRIRTYTKVGVDANRAAALDLVADGKTGATVTDQRNFVDAGPGIVGLAAALINKIPGGK